MSATSARLLSAIDVVPTPLPTLWLGKVMVPPAGALNRWSRVCLLTPYRQALTPTPTSPSCYKYCSSFTEGGMPPLDRRRTRGGVRHDSGLTAENATVGVDEFIELVRRGGTYLATQAKRRDYFAAKCGAQSTISRLGRSRPRIRSTYRWQYILRRPSTRASAVFLT